MANPFPYESFQWLWYEYWIPVAAAGVAIFALAVIWGTTKQGLYSSFIRVLAVLAALSTIPLASERIDMGVSGDEDVMLLMSVGGAATGLTLLLFHILVLLAGRRGRRNDLANVGARSDFGDQSSADDGYKAADDFKTSVETEGPAARTSVGSAQAPPVMDDRTIVETKPRTTGAWLTVQSGAEAGQVIGVTEDVTRIGRSSDNHIVLSDAAISRSHAVIRKSGNDYEISDLGSSGGVTVNGQRISGSDVASGSTIKIGQTELVATDVETAEQLPETDPKFDRTMVATPGQTRYVLLCKSGPQAGMSFSVGEGASTLGRDVSSDVHIDDPAVSRKHATLSVRSGKLTISDEGSSGGTFVNGQRLSGTRLNNDTAITLGNVRLTFVCPAQS
jgi:pSer/pThr/pTyr-binding forkhead associated (FHA) protein